MQFYDNAKSICLQQEIGYPSIIMINSLDQQFIEKFLFQDNQIYDNVWLGAKRDPKTKTFHWDDASNPKFTYSNWEEIKNGSNFDCVQMIPNGKEKGKWTDTSCKKNIVVCHLMQDWTFARLQKVFRFKKIISKTNYSD